jgi:[acyl-carrier-protein] S-malonyltransferase
MMGRVLDPTLTAVLFPGQGSQTTGMRELVASVRADLLEAASELVGEDPFARVEDSTRFAQPAILCASLAGWTLLQDRVDPVALTGHSLGELSALAAAGALDEHDALRLVALRGQLMAESGEASGGGTMLALLGGTPAQASALAARHGVSVANDNAPGQVVLSGARDALQAVRGAAREDGLRALDLDVAGAFHSPQMAAAVEPFREALAEVDFREPTVPVISCASTKPFGEPREELADALVNPVRWRETMATLADMGAQAFVDAGPGRVLAKLAPQCVPGAAATTLETLVGDISALA